ncbi:hypothetical protein BDR03DRAFT_966650 [Suillus americanus]|nr:hypothetical protein BDR03DRAFT_966650 [Suillus americanus]
MVYDCSAAHAPVPDSASSFRLCNVFLRGIGSDWPWISEAQVRAVQESAARQTILSTRCSHPSSRIRVC